MGNLKQIDKGNGNEQTNKTGSGMKYNIKQQSLSKIESDQKGKINGLGETNKQWNYLEPKKQEKSIWLNNQGPIDQIHGKRGKSSPVKSILSEFTGKNLKKNTDNIQKQDGKIKILEDVNKRSKIFDIITKEQEKTKDQNLNTIDKNTKITTNGLLGNKNYRTPKERGIDQEDLMKKNDIYVDCKPDLRNNQGKINTPNKGQFDNNKNYRNFDKIKGNTPSWRNGVKEDEFKSANNRFTIGVTPSANIKSKEMDKLEQFKDVKGFSPISITNNRRYIRRRSLSNLGKGRELILGGLKHGLRGAKFVYDKFWTPISGKCAKKKIINLDQKRPYSQRREESQVIKKLNFNSKPGDQGMENEIKQKRISEIMGKLDNKTAQLLMNIQEKGKKEMKELEKWSLQDSTNKKREIREVGEKLILEIKQEMEINMENVDLKQKNNIDRINNEGEKIVKAQSFQKKKQWNMKKILKISMKIKCLALKKEQRII